MFGSEERAIMAVVNVVVSILIHELWGISGASKNF